MASFPDETLLLAAASIQAVCFLLGGLLPLVLPNRQQGMVWSLFLSGGAGLLTLVTGILFSFCPMEKGYLLPFYHMQTSAWSHPLHLELFVDRLTAFFLILTGGLNIAAVLHMSGWLPGQPDRHRIVSAYNLLMLFILLALLANTAYFYLLFLEGMTLAFAYLALFRHNQVIEIGAPQGELARTAGPEPALAPAKTAFKAYLIFEHLGVTFLAAALLVLSVQQSAGGLAGFDFDEYRAIDWQGRSTLAAPEIYRVHFSGQEDASRPGAANLAFLLALAGFGIKAGVFPAHVWVPLVHPYSPTSIHAIMSGIVLKVAGIYGMYRFFFEFLQPGAWWWGVLVLLLAGATTLVGVFYALIMRDLKTALASHSVENIGIILTGIGLALVYRWAASQLATQNGESEFSPLSALASLALAASLFHLLNHSIFKSLLFFCTGAIENRVGTTALDRLGGLIKRYPWTSLTFLVGAASIAGMPPLNGFASEWLTLQVLFAGLDVFSPAVPARIFLLFGFVAALLCLAMAIGLTAMAFVKIAGEALLGMPRDPQLARQARPGEAPRAIRAVLVTLAGLCLLLGVFASPVARGLGAIAASLNDGRAGGTVDESYSLVLQLPLDHPDTVEAQKQASGATATTGAEILRNHYSSRMSFRFVLALAALLGATITAIVLGRPARLAGWLRPQRGPVWTGGEPYQPDRMQVTGGAMTSLVWMHFEDRAVPAGRLPAGEQENVLPVRIPVTQARAVREYFRDGYDRAVSRLLVVSQRLGEWIQNGDVRRSFIYIFYVFVLALVAILVITGAGR
jgi:formate hydrogenlyase subunit 3/multisubunit Na+/H+ antiporter MnhD subunit